MEDVEDVDRLNTLGSVSKQEGRKVAVSTMFAVLISSEDYGRPLQNRQVLEHGSC